MRLRRVQFDAYNNQFQTLDSADRDDADTFVLPDFSLEDFPLPEDLDFTELGDFDFK